MSDGNTFLEYLNDILKQEKDQSAKSGSIVVQDKLAYEFGDIGACELAKKTLLLRKTASIQTVASQRTYNLPPDYIRMVVHKNFRIPVIRYTKDGETDGVFIEQGSYQDFWAYDTDQTEDVPGCFDILPYNTSDLSAITGTTSAAGAESDGESTLTEAGKLFTTTNLVYPRYRVHNTTKKYHGIVLAVSSAAALNTAMFKDKACMGWGNGELYRIQSTGNYKLIFDYATLNADDTIDIEYYCLPSPVFSPYGVWGFQDPEYTFAIACYAAWLFKFRSTKESVKFNMESLTSDKLYLMFGKYVDDALADKTERYYFPRLNQDLLDVM
uniref:Uncharacterized protein n=1 Tax=viral metagenome TaxID=1070528 RepID=A0A6H1ZSW4_9ZZZZ